MIFIAPPAPHSFILTVAHPLGTNFFFFLASLKIKDGSHKFHQDNTKHSPAKITPALQVNGAMELFSCRGRAISVLLILLWFFFSGNLLIIIAFFTTTKLKTKTNYFIFSLAVADLLVGLFSVPLWIYFILTLDFRNALYEYYQMGDIVSGVSSILHLTCISIERCYAIVAPLKHRKISKGM